MIPYSAFQQYHTQLVRQEEAATRNPKRHRVYCVSSNLLCQLLYCVILSSTAVGAYRQYAQAHTDKRHYINNLQLISDLANERWFNV